MVHADQLLPHMRRVQVAERDLCDLSVLWQMIETSAAISCPAEVASLMPTLVETRERFEAIARRNDIKPAIAEHVSDKLVRRRLVLCEQDRRHVGPYRPVL